MPSIWIGKFRTGQEWEAEAAERDAVLTVFDAIDDKVMSSRHPFDVQAWCSVCCAVRPMAHAWHIGSVNAEGSVNPAWTENGCCHSCGLVSRNRALVDYLQGIPEQPEAVYTAERLTPGYAALAQLYPGIVGSEFLGADHLAGSVHRQKSGVDVRHEDMTALSFGDNSFDLVVTQDVFEHIPNYAQSFKECRRVLRSAGRLVFTIPFFVNPTTEIRATVDETGSVTHLLPPEIHGNPLGDGSLCFQHFGWDILDTLRLCGFENATANMYWGPWAGHLGYPMFVFEACSG